jgi:hypothetical protein
MGEQKQEVTPSSPVSESDNNNNVKSSESSPSEVRKPPPGRKKSGYLRSLLKIRSPKADHENNAAHHQDVLSPMITTTAVVSGGGGSHPATNNSVPPSPATNPMQDGRSHKEDNHLPACSSKAVSVHMEDGGLPRRRPSAPSSRGVGKAKSFGHRGGDFARGVRRNHSSAEKYLGTSRYSRHPHNEVDGILKPQRKIDAAYPKVFTASKKKDKAAKAKPAVLV